MNTTLIASIAALAFALSAQAQINTGRVPIEPLSPAGERFGRFKVPDGAIRKLSAAQAFADGLGAKSPKELALQGFEWVETGRSWSPPRWKRMAMR